MQAIVFPAMPGPCIFVRRKHSFLTPLHSTPLRIPSTPKGLRTIAKGCRASARLPWYRVQPDWESKPSTPAHPSASSSVCKKHRLATNLNPSIARIVVPALAGIWKRSSCKQLPNKWMLLPSVPQSSRLEFVHSAVQTIPPQSDTLRLSNLCSAKSVLPQPQLTTSPSQSHSASADPPDPPPPPSLQEPPPHSAGGTLSRRSASGRSRPTGAD